MDLGDQAKKTLKAYVVEIDPQISQYFDSETSKHFGFNTRQKDLVDLMLEHAKEYILRPTKRLRASFVHFGYKLSGKEPNEQVRRAAVGVELVHAALLMHDDFMDLDERRRKGPTTHKYFEQQLKGSEHFGQAMAVSLGDALLCLGFELTQSQQMLRGIANTAYGQAYDVSLETLTEATEDDVLTLHKAKTAIYTYENPLFIGAELAGLSKEALGILHDYSMDGGVAFQLRDDVLGVFGDPEETGKSANSDLLQGKVTLLILYVLQHGTEQQKAALKKIWGKRAANVGDIEAAKQAIKDSGSLEHSQQLTENLAHKAARIAEKLRDLNLNTEAIDYLQGIAEYMVKREV